MPRLVDDVVRAGALAAMTQPVLDLGDARLRPWAPRDAPAVERAYQDPGIQRWHARSLDAGEAAAWVAQWPGRWAAESGAGWAIADDERVLGQLSLRRITLGEGDAEISYWMLPEARGRRLASRALAAVTEWSFGRLGLHRLEVRHATENLASCRVAERAGFAYEGALRSQALHAEGWLDMHVHARISEDLPGHAGDNEDLPGRAGDSEDTPGHGRLSGR